MIRTRTNAINWRNPVKPGGLNDGLVNWWLASGPSVGGNIWLDLCGKNNGTLGTSTARPAWSPRGLVFDGGDYVDVAAFSQSDFSCSLWIYATSTTSGERVIDAAGTSTGFAIYRNGTANSFLGTIFGFGAGSALAVNNSEWTQIVLTRQGTNCATYVNGGTLSSSNSGIGTSTATGNMSIGARNFHDLNFTGSIDDIRLYSRSLTASDVRALYQDSLAGWPQTLSRLERRVGYVAASSSFNPAWARNATTLIGAGCA